MDLLVYFMLNCFLASVRPDPDLVQKMEQLQNQVNRLKAQRLDDEHKWKMALVWQRRNTSQSLLEGLQSQDRHWIHLDMQMSHLHTTLENLDRNRNRHTALVQNLQNEILFVKSELDAIKQRVGQTNVGEKVFNAETQSENSAKTLRWLMKSVQELKRDVMQIDRNLNMSTSIQRAEKIDKSVESIQTEIGQLRHQLAQGKAANDLLAAQLVQLKTDLAESTRRFDLLYANMAQINSKDQSSPSRATKSRRIPSRRPRCRSFNRQIGHLKNAIRKLREQFEDGEKQWKHLLIDRTIYLGPTTRDDSMRGNLTVDEAALRRLDLGQRTLTDQVGLMEERTDLELDDFRHYVHNVQLNLTQLAVNSEKMIQNQENYENRLNEFTHSFGIMEQQLETDRWILLNLQNQLLNQTIQRCRNETADLIRQVKLQDIESQMDILNQQLNN